MRLQHERCFHYALVRNEYVGGFGQTIRGKVEMIWTYDEGRHAGGRCDVRRMILSPNRSSPKKKKK